MDGSPPDLFAGDPGWEFPLTDLTDAAASGDDVRRGAGGALPGQEHDTGRDAGGVPPADFADPETPGALPDLTGSAAGAAPDATGSASEAPLPELSRSAARAPRDLAESVPGAMLPDLGGDGGDDLWAPALQAVPLVAEDGEGDESLTDLTRRPRRSRRGRRAVSGRGTGGDGGPRAVGRDAGRPRAAGGADGPEPAGPLARDRRRDDRPSMPGPVAEALAAARDLGSSSGTGTAHDGSTPGEPRDEPRGLATGGPIGGLEPGTLFGPAAGDRPGAPGTRGRKRRRGRRGRDEDAPGADAGAVEPERPLTAEERLQHALKLSYQHLTKRDRTVSEVRAHLEKREVDEASIVGALAELVEFRYLDDERYASRYVEDKRRLEGWGHLRIEQGLRRTGVPREVADRAVAADPQRGDEAELAVETLEQRLNGRAPGDDRGRQKALRLLATKGYALETAYEAVRTYERRCAERDDD